MFKQCLLLITLLVSSTTAFSANIGVYGSTDITTELNTQGHTATNIALANFTDGTIVPLDLLVLSRGNTFNAGACTALQAFLNNGGGVITEWNGVSSIFTTLGGSVYLPWDTQCALFTGTADRGAGIATNTPITFTAAAPLNTGLTNPFAMGGGSEFFYQVTGYDASLWTVHATYDGWAALGNAALMSAPYNGAGTVVVGVMDFHDVIGTDTNAKTLLANMVNLALLGLPSSSTAVPTLSQLGIFILVLLLLTVSYRNRKVRQYF